LLSKRGLFGFLSGVVVTCLVLLASPHSTNLAQFKPRGKGSGLLLATSPLLSRVEDAREPFTAEVLPITSSNRTTQTVGITTGAGSLGDVPPEVCYFILARWSTVNWTEPFRTQTVLRLLVSLFAFTTIEILFFVVKLLKSQMALLGGVGRGHSYGRPPGADHAGTFLKYFNTLIVFFEHHNRNFLYHYRHAMTIIL
jgi:hypothetical protein